MRKILTVFFFCFSFNVLAQKIEYPAFTGTFDNSPLQSVFNTISGSTGVSIYYHTTWLRDVKVTASFNKEPLEDVIRVILSGTGLSWLAYDHTNLVIMNEDVPLFLIDLLEESGDPGGKENLVVIGQQLNTTRKVVLTGKIRDGGTGEPLSGATLYFEEIEDGVVSGADGIYSIELNSGRYHVKVEFLGYVSEYRVIGLLDNGEFDLELFESVVELNEVLITQSRIDENVKSVQISLEKMDIKTMRIQPQFMGETDIIKGLMILPGVSTVGEGASGFNVRGGTVGQNLILQDEALIFNSSHMFGFFSAFNPDVVQGVTLYKGNPPATEGGRISSILDVQLKNGSRDRVHFAGGIGTVSSKLVVDGPFAKGKGNYLFGGRISYINWFLKNVDNLQVQQSRANFYDLNARLNYNISKKDILTISAYKSLDNFKLATDTTISWMTQNISGIWMRSITPDLLSKLSIAYGQFDTDVRNEMGINAFELESYIHHLRTKLLLTYLVQNHKLDFGISAVNYSIEPGVIKPGEGSFNLQAVDVQNENSLESAIFINDEFRISDNLSLNAGLRYSHFRALGPKDIYIYEEGIPKKDNTIIGSREFSTNETIKSYGGLEPRISLRYLLAPGISVKTGYARNRQYIHFVSNTAVTSPQDYWINSTYYIPPLIGDQVSVGYFQNFRNNSIEFSTEAFYKKLTGVLDYKEGSKILLNETLEQDVVSGIGRAYGIEVMINKKKGRLTGRLSYTYSRSERKFESPFKSERISLGEYYPSYYDKPHDLSVLFNYNLTRGIKFSANFTYASGRPITAPVSKYSYEQMLSILNFSKRNQFRIPDYHRLDISFTFGTGYRKDRKLNDEVVFSIYNLYGRRNAYSVYFNQAGWAYRLSVLGTIFPSISYSFKI